MNQMITRKQVLFFRLEQKQAASKYNALLNGLFRFEPIDALTSLELRTEVSRALRQNVQRHAGKIIEKDIRRVIHILEKNKVWQEPTPFSLVEFDAMGGFSVGLPSKQLLHDLLKAPEVLVETVLIVQSQRKMAFLIDYIGEDYFSGDYYEVHFVQMSRDSQRVISRIQGESGG